MNRLKWMPSLTWGALSSQLKDQIDRRMDFLSGKENWPLTWDIGCFPVFDLEPKTWLFLSLQPAGLWTPTTPPATTKIYPRNKKNDVSPLANKFVSNLESNNFIDSFITFIFLRLLLFIVSPLLLCHSLIF